MCLIWSTLRPQNLKYVHGRQEKSFEGKNAQDIKVDGEGGSWKLKVYAGIGVEEKKRRKGRDGLTTIKNI